MGLAPLVLGQKIMAIPRKMTTSKPCLKLIKLFQAKTIFSPDTKMILKLLSESRKNMSLLKFLVGRMQPTGKNLIPMVKN
jgi:hypothetical protein